jgi:hypothetical protein
MKRRHLYVPVIVVQTDRCKVGISKTCIRMQVDVLVYDEFAAHTDACDMQPQHQYVRSNMRTN